jgi:hypothetical protein
MSQDTIERLLAGAEGISVNLSNGRCVKLTRRELGSVEAFRQVWLDLGFNPPELTQTELDDLLGVLGRLADGVAHGAAA